MKTEIKFRFSFPFTTNSTLEQTFSIPCVCSRNVPANANSFQNPQNITQPELRSTHTHLRIQLPNFCIETKTQFQLPIITERPLLRTVPKLEHREPFPSPSALHMHISFHTAEKAPQATTSHPALVILGLRLKSSGAGPSFIESLMPLSLSSSSFLYFEQNPLNDYSKQGVTEGTNFSYPKALEDHPWCRFRANSARSVRNLHSP